MSEPSLSFTLSTYVHVVSSNLSMVFSEIWKKIWVRYLKETINRSAWNMCHPISLILSSGLWRRSGDTEGSVILVPGPQEEQHWSLGRNANVLQLQIVVEQKSPFFASETVSSAFILSSQMVRVCVKTLSKTQWHTHTHTHAHMQGGEVRNHSLSLPSPLFWKTEWTCRSD